MEEAKHPEDSRKTSRLCGNGSTDTQSGEEECGPSAVGLCLPLAGAGNVGDSGIVSHSFLLREISL